jgi:uncharacterized protein (DUF2141 family)
LNENLLRRHRDARGRRADRVGMAGCGLVWLLLAAGAAPAAELVVTVDDLRSDAGDVRLSLFASAAEWPDNSTADHDRVEPARRGGVTFIFDVPPGIYAIAGFHDENRNGKFDTNFLGLPREGFLFSNDARPTLHEPSFAAASFTVPPEGARIRIRMVYW